MGRWIELLKYFRRDDRSNFETVRFNRTMATITTIIRSRTSIAAIMTSGLLRYRTCLPNKPQVVAIPTCLWSDGTRSLPLPIVNIRPYREATRWSHDSSFTDHRKKKNILHDQTLFLPSYSRFISKMILIRNLVARTIKYDDIDSLTVFPSWTKNRIETQTNQRGRWNERRTYSPPPSHPNPRHVVYFIALLALLHQFPSVYTSPAVVTALSLPFLLPSP